MQQIKAFWRSGLIGKIVLSVAGLFVTLIVCCVGILLIPTPARTTTTRSTAEVAIVSTKVPSSTSEQTAAPSTSTPEPIAPPTDTPTAGPTQPPLPTSTPAPPTPPPSLAQQVRTAVDAVLSNSNRKVERITTALADPDQQEPQIFIRWTINDNLTDGLIKGGARLDIEKMLKAIQALNVPYTAVLVEGTFPLVDKLGNSEEAVVIHALYPKTTIDKINWPNFNRDNVYAIADDVTIHPAFQE